MLRTSGASYCTRNSAGGQNFDARETSPKPPPFAAALLRRAPAPPFARFGEKLRYEGGLSRGVAFSVRRETPRELHLQRAVARGLALEGVQIVAQADIVPPRRAAGFDHVYVVRHDAAGIVLDYEKELPWNVLAPEYEAVPPEQLRL